MLDKRRNVFFHRILVPSFLKVIIDKAKLPAITTGKKTHRKNMELKSIVVTFLLCLYNEYKVTDTLTCPIPYYLLYEQYNPAYL